MVVSHLGSLLQDTVELEGWVLVDVDVWADSLLGHSEVFALWVDTD